MTEREEIIERLRGIERDEINLSRIYKAVMDKHDLNWRINELLELRDKLIDLLSTDRKDEQTPTIPSDRRITDELRKWLDKYTMRKDTYDKMIAIIDRIDAEHEDALSKVHIDMSDSEQVYLPKDADDEVIHIGDKLHDKWNELISGEVEWLMLNNHGWWLKFKENCERFYLHDFHEWHHHKQLTVENLLRDMHAKLNEVTALYIGEAIDSDERDNDETRIFAEYATKLQLRGDAE